MVEINGSCVNTSELREHNFDLVVSSFDILFILLTEDQMIYILQV